LRTNLFAIRRLRWAAARAVKHVRLPKAPLGSNVAKRLRRAINIRNKRAAENAVVFFWQAVFMLLFITYTPPFAKWQEILKGGEIVRLIALRTPLPRPVFGW